MVFFTLFVFFLIYFLISVAFFIFLVCNTWGNTICNTFIVLPFFYIWNCYYFLNIWFCNDFCNIFSNIFFVTVFFTFGIVVIFYAFGLTTFTTTYKTTFILLLFLQFLELLVFFCVWNEEAKDYFFILFISSSRRFISLA